MRESPFLHWIKILLSTYYLWGSVMPPYCMWPCTLPSAWGYLIGAKSHLQLSSAILVSMTLTACPLVSSDGFHPASSLGQSPPDLLTAA